MAVCKEVVELQNSLNSISAMQKDCREIFCTTCGGKSRAVLGRRCEFRGPVEAALAQASVEDLWALSAWLPVLVELAPASFSSALLRNSEAIGADGVNSQDRFVLIASKYRGQSRLLEEIYLKVVAVAEKSARETEDESLIETLVLVLGPDLLGHQDLLSLALSKNGNPKVAKALYNKLRDHLPEVRGYMVTEPPSGTNLQ